MRIALLLAAAVALASCDGSDYVTPEVSYIRGSYVDTWQVQTPGSWVSKRYALTLRLIERDGVVTEAVGDAGELSIVRSDAGGTQGYREIYRVKTRVETIAGTYDVAENRVQLTVRGQARDGSMPFSGTFTGRLGVASDRIEGTFRATLSGMPDGTHEIDQALVLEPAY